MTKVIIKMDRYYSILGIPSNSSKEVIKSAYHARMKALHPDKIHGTPLEDTANFFTVEINEAYTNLMAQFKNTASSSTGNNPAFIEEEVYVETMGYLKYTLSNDLGVIINEIYKRVHCTIPDSSSKIPWNINHDLSPNVKNSMNKHNLNYSMTSFLDGSIEFVIINKRSDSNWYIAGYEVFSQPKQSANSETYYNSDKYTSYSKQKSHVWIFVKIVVALVIFSFIFYQCNNHQATRIQQQASSSRPAQVFATVVSCDWLNVRITPSSVNDNNIIDAIHVKARVEILEKTNNGWVKIRYGNGRTGYVHNKYLSR